MNDYAVQQCIRRSHCVHENRNHESHECVGTCAITRDGLRFSCVKCGHENVGEVDYENRLTARD